MTTRISPNDTPWLRAHPPFMEWLEANGVDPFDARSLTFSEDFGSMEIEVFKKDQEGKRYFDYAKKDMATEVVTKKVIVPFPMRFLEEETAR